MAVPDPSLKATLVLFLLLCFFVSHSRLSSRPSRKSILVKKTHPAFPAVDLLHDPESALSAFELFLQQQHFNFSRNDPFRASTNTTWRVLWTGGQSNSVGVNLKTALTPTWPTTNRIQSFCWKASRDCVAGTFVPSAVPLPGELNVGFLHTLANLLLPSLPLNDGIVLINTGEWGTGFHDKKWSALTGPLAVQSVKAMSALHTAFATAPFTGGGQLFLHAMLWHQGEADAGDNQVSFHADYCTYLSDLSALIDFFRANFPGARPSTPFVNGGLLPYWFEGRASTEGVVSAISALNTSRVCTGTADSRIFPAHIDGAPYGDPVYLSGVSRDVIHFSATQQVLFGFQYHAALLRAKAVTAVVPSPATAACARTVQPPVVSCG